MKNFLTALVLLSSVSAFAEVEIAPSRCEYSLKLSDSQKLEIKELSKASAEKLKALGAEIKAAKLAADKVLSKIEASKEEAVAASQALAAKVHEVSSIKSDEKLAVLFDVLTPEQRLKKVKCEKAELGQRGHRGQHPQSGGISHGPYRVPAPRGPGRIERHPAPNYRPGRVIISRPQGPVRPGQPGRPTRRGGVVHPVI